MALIGNLKGTQGLKGEKGDLIYNPYNFLNFSKKTSVQTQNGIVVNELSGSTAYSAIHTEIDVNTLTMEKTQWVFLGKGNGYGVAISLFDSFVGMLVKILDNGNIVNSNISLFGTIAANVTRVRIVHTVTTISIYTTLDNNVYSLHSTFLKSAMEYQIITSQMGVLFVNSISNFHFYDTPIFTLDSYVKGNFFGKRAVLLGDSITESGGLNGYYTQRVKNMLGLAEIVNEGHSGATYSSRTSNNLSNDTLLSRIKNLNPDLIIIFGGTNDYWNGESCVLGLADSTNTVETAGGLNYILQYFSQNLQLCRVVVCTPTQRELGNNNNPQGKKLIDYVSVIKQVCVLNSVICIDFFATSGINMRSTASLSAYTTDGLHLNNAGYDRITALQNSIIRDVY